MFARTARLVDTPAHSLKLVSPYFVPTARGTALFEKLAARGVDVAILTNALEATDVAVVHAGYMPWRVPLLRAGELLTHCTGLHVLAFEDGVIGQPPAPALRVHVTAHMRHSELARERLHVRSIEVRIRTEVVMHVNHDNTAMRGSPPHDRRARRNKHAGVHASRAPHRERSSCCPAAAHDKLASHLSSQRMTSDA
jgi:hypothetical protein